MKVCSQVLVPMALALALLTVCDCLVVNAIVGPGAQATVRYVLGAAGILGSVTVLAAWALLERRVIRRLRRMSHELERIGACGEPSARLDEAGGDEWAHLAAGINAVLAAHRDRLEQLVHDRSVELLLAQQQALHAEKLASVGQLAAGVAHEINTPIQYVGDNLRALSDYFTDLTTLLGQYRELAQLVESAHVLPEAIEQLRAGEAETDLDYVVADVPKAITQAREGVDRVTHIVRAMKDFSHVDRGEVSVVDLNRALENALTVARNEYKYVADVVTAFGDLPEVECFAGEINQVILNLLVNAAHAVADSGTRGVVTIRTRPAGDHVEIDIEDTGTGIPEAIRGKIFDPFFTTKEVGRGTGQGLTIAHQIIVKRHAGALTLRTEVGQGTTFTIRLPVRMAAPQEAVVGTDT